MRGSCLPYETLRILICVGATLVAGVATAQNARFEQFGETSPRAGEMAPDFTLLTVDGEEFTLSDAYAEQPVVIEFGSYT